MNITVNVGEESLKFWIPKYQITSSSVYSVTTEIGEYPTWLTPLLIQSEESDAAGNQFTTIQFAFGGTSYPTENFTMKQTQTIREKINCHKTQYEYLIKVNVGYCLESCGSHLLLPIIEPSIFTYQLNDSETVKEINLPAFWSYTAT